MGLRPTSAGRSEADLTSFRPVCPPSSLPAVDAAPVPLSLLLSLVESPAFLSVLAFSAALFFSTESGRVVVVLVVVVAWTGSITVVAETSISSESVTKSGFLVTDNLVTGELVTGTVNDGGWLERCTEGRVLIEGSHSTSTVSSWWGATTPAVLPAEANITPPGETPLAVAVVIVFFVVVVANVVACALLPPVSSSLGILWDDEGGGVEDRMDSRPPPGELFAVTAPIHRVSTDDT